MSSHNHENKSGILFDFSSIIVAYYIPNVYDTRTLGFNTRFVV